ncbi:cupin domain-containing protein [Alkalicoccobacillus porphyridii]|nr:cupin domain-containing protein [Alkalicoccobacillus porphyridii]
MTETRIGYISLEENGLLGGHEAIVPQLLVVMSGEGTVSNDSESLIITEGDAVFWDRGEQHETSSVKGMTAIIIESDSLQPYDLIKKELL